ncbi:MAG: SEA (Seh1-associated) complex subunit [Thelocarpon superellum]|nr:MAG: SEA (Seh1-associated) complex subunit [Thelocarpon superellum]
MSDLFSPRFALPAPPAPPPPPAPPLPPQRYVNRATTALARFAQPFIGPARPSSAQAHRADDRPEKALAPPLPRAVSPLTSQTATHKTGIAIAAVDISPQRTHAVLAGREILKTIRVAGATCAEEFNLRAAIIAYASTHNTGAGAGAALKHRDDLAANDVKWSHGSFSSTIATACPNGRIMLYDVNRAGVELARLHEHNRQVHKLAFNPHQGSLLLSASQDATLRLWDLRAAAAGRSVMNFRSAGRYKGNAEGMRDVKWSPTDGTGFACATDAGVVQRWDFRKDAAPLQKLNAHKRVCLSIDWHPDGIHLASAGVDKMVQVWDLSTLDRRQNSPWSFRAPQAVTKVRWRPVGWQARAQGAGSWETTQLVTCYDSHDPRVHLWDLKTPYVPFREIDRYNTAPTDMLWHSEHLLWTVGLAGMFTQTDMHFAPKLRDRRPLQAFDVAPTGEISFYGQPRLRSPHLDLGGGDDEDDDEDDAATLPRSASGRSKPGSGEKLSGSRSSGENELSNTLLSSSLKHRHGRPPGAKSSRSVGNTPPSETSALVVANLRVVLHERPALDMMRFAACGGVYAGFNPAVFRHLATASRNTPARAQLRTVHDIDRVQAAMQRNARVAQAAGMYRLAQTWQILESAALTEVWRRARERREARLRRAEEAKRATDETDGTPADGSKKVASKTRPGKAMEGLGESTSNMTTPVARPVSDASPRQRAHPSRSRFDEADALVLPESTTQSWQSSNSDDPGADESNSSMEAERALRNRRASPWSRQASTGGEARRSRSQLPAGPRPPLRLDLPDGADRSRPPMSRFDSTESFTMFSASTDGKHSLPNSLGSVMESGSAVDRVKVSDSLTRTDSSSESGQREPVLFRLETSSLRSYVGRAPRSTYRESSTPDEDRMEASGTIVPEDHAPEIPPAPVYKPSPVTPDGVPASDAHGPSAVTSPSTPSFIAADLARPSSGMGGQKDVPWSATSLFERTVAFHITQLSDQLTASHLLLLLQPFTPADTLPPGLATSILHTYHGQLMALSLFVPAAHLRRLCVPDHPSIYNAAKDACALVFKCTSCGGRPSTIQTATLKRTAWLCDKCKRLQAPCPICRLRTHPVRPSPHITKRSSGGIAGLRSGGPPRRGRWGWCQGCGHGGHASCLEAWWANPASEGGCAVEGCLHDCIKGPRRREREELRAKEKRLQKLGSFGVAAAALHKNKAGEDADGEMSKVKKDTWTAPESRAVQRLRLRERDELGLGL